MLLLGHSDDLSHRFVVEGTNRDRAGPRGLGDLLRENGRTHDPSFLPGAMWPSYGQRRIERASDLQVRAGSLHATSAAVTTLRMPLEIPCHIP